MPVARFRRKPTEILAVRLGDGNAQEVADWVGGAVVDGQLQLPQVQIGPEAGDWVVRNVLPGGLSAAFAVRPEVFDWAWSVVE